MTSKITPAEMLDDYDWSCAFYEAVHHCHMPYSERIHNNPVTKVTDVHYAVEGENEGDDWLAVVGWSGEEGPFAVMSAGCDYTGWD